MQERENILRIFQETKEALPKGDVVKIQTLSNQTTNTASLTHDPDNIAAAVVVYALSKILQNQDYRKLPGWNEFYQIYATSIDKIIDAIKRKDDKAYDQNIEIIRSAIGKLSGKLKSYIQDVFRSASIDKASRIYEHGISMEKTAKLLGVTMFDLASYAGEKGAVDVPETRTITAGQRIKIAMEFFK
jgi:hypothetical protein